MANAAPLPIAGGTYELDGKTGKWVLTQQTVPASADPSPDSTDGTYEESPDPGEG